MSEPRFDWEADRDEWERFREMDRKWKAMVDERLAYERRLDDRLQQRIAALEAHVAEILVQAAEEEARDDS